MNRGDTERTKSNIDNQETGASCAGFLHPVLAAAPRFNYDAGGFTSRMRRPVFETRSSNYAGRVTGTNVAEPYSASTRSLRNEYRWIRS